jgi:hypothetical protein
MDPFREMCNSAKTNLGFFWLHFEPNPQIEIEWRINLKQCLISSGKLNISLECPII